MALDLTLSNDVVASTGASASEVAEKLLFVEYAEAITGIDFTLEEEEEIFEWLTFNTDNEADNDVEAPIITSEDGEVIDLVSVFAGSVEENEDNNGDRFDEDGNPVNLPPAEPLSTEGYTDEEKAINNKILANREVLEATRLEALSQNPPDLATARLIERNIRDLDKAREELQSIPADRNQSAIEQASDAAETLVKAVKSGTDLIQGMANTVSDIASGMGEARKKAAKASSS